jgi:pyrimidine oxygenase
MQLGVFLPIANNGWIVSTASPQYMPTYALNRDICVEAERAGFDFALSMVKFRGFGGQTEYWDYAVDAFTLMAALAEATSTLELHASVASPTLHPAMTARMIATMDDISGGRVGVNMVSGWNKQEYLQMGMWPGDEFYGQRYDYSTEYVEVMRKLWADGRATHHGKYFELLDCECQPTPSREVPILCAGQSERGIRFAAEVGDYNFVLGELETLSSMREQLNQACAKTGREVGAYALFGIIAAETDAEATATAQRYLDGADRVALENLMLAGAADKNAAMMKKVREALAAPVSIEFPDDRLAAVVHGGCFTIPHLVGSYARVAAYLDAAHDEAGMDGAIMTYPDFVPGVREFSRSIGPLMTSRETLVQK